jgi:hypothetical protein
MLEALENMTAVNTQAGDVHIGHLFWYSIGDDLYGRNLLEQNLVQNALSIGFMPKEIRLYDAFRRATKEIETKVNLGNGVCENYMIRDVYNDTYTAIRHIVKERVDSQGQRLSYSENEAIITLDRNTGEMSYTADLNSYARELSNEAKRLLELFRNYHNGQAVHGMVQNILKTLSPTPVRPSGGVYFVPASYDEELQKLTGFCSAFPKGEGFKIQVVNSAESLKMVEQKVSDHLESIYGQCKQAVADSSVSKPRVSDIIGEAKRVIAGYKNYEGILSQKKEEMEARILLIRDSVSILLEKADDE